MNHNAHEDHEEERDLCDRRGLRGSLLSLLHVCDSLFPIGSFAYSDGLESAAAARLVTGADGVREWLDVSLDEAFGRCDGPAVLRAWRDCGDERWAAIVALDEELTALRPAATARLSSRSTGRRLLVTWAALHPDPRLRHALALVESGTLGPTLPVAFGLVCGAAGIEARSAVEAFAYTRLAAVVSAAMRLVPIGQNESHALLARALERVPAVVDRLIARDAPPESFAPALDISMITHQYVHSRLFRS